MGLNNIRVARSALGGHTRVVHARLAAATLLRGEFAQINAGDATEAADDAAATAVLGISGGGPSTAFSGEINPKTNLAYAAGDVVPIIVGDDDTAFVTSNFTTAAGGPFGNAAPTRALIGTNLNIEVIGGVHGVGNAGANAILYCVDVIDARGMSLNETNAGAGVSVVFKFNRSDWNQG